MTQPDYHSFFFVKVSGTAQVGSVGKTLFRNLTQPDNPPPSDDISKPSTKKNQRRNYVRGFHSTF